MTEAGAPAEIAKLLIATGRTTATDVHYAERTATAARRFAEVAEQLLEAALQEAVEADEELFADIRRWFVQPQESYTVEELAAMLRSTVEDARDIYHDEIVQSGDRSEGCHARVGWTNALVTAATYGLLRPFDIERALGVDFVKARSGEGWRTVPVLIRIPRFVADAIVREPAIAPHRKTVARWRLDRRDVRRKDMVRILWAVRTVSNNPSVRIEDLFDLDPDNENNWRD